MAIKINTHGRLPEEYNRGSLYELFQKIDDAVNKINTTLASGVAVSDGDKGDITVSSSGAVWNIDANAVGTTEIANDAVTYAKVQNVSTTDRVLGRDTAGAGDIEELTLSNVLDFVGSPAQGDILYRGSSTWARLGAGTAGEVLVTQGASANPVWSATPNPTWNKVINGDMQISQLKTSFASASTATGSTTLDKWVATYSLSTATFTVSQTGSAPTTGEFNKSLNIACDATETPLSTTTRYFSINNPIEGYNISELFGTTFTLSFWVKNTVTGIFCVRLSNNNPDDTTNGRVYVAEYTINTTNTWEFKTITVTGGLTTGGLWDSTTGIGLTASFVLACGSGLTTVGGGSVVKDTWYTPNTTPIVATPNQVNFFTSTSNTFVLTGVQINIGASASRFEHVLYGPALARCQRYCYKFTGPAAGIVKTSTSIVASIPFPVEMRLQPSVSVPSGVSVMSINTVISGAYGSANASSASMSIDTSSRNGATLLVNNFTNLTNVGDSVIVQGGGSSAYYCFFESYI